MGRAEIALDTDTLLDLQEMGLTQPQAAQELGISAQTLSKRIAKLQEKQGLLLQYRAIQSLQLTELQARVLEAITPEKIQDAQLHELVSAFKILKDKELVIEGKPSEIKGLVAYLIEMEKQEAALVEPVAVEDIEEVKEISREITDENYLPNLGE